MLRLVRCTQPRSSVVLIGLVSGCAQTRADARCPNSDE